MLLRSSHCCHLVTFLLMKPRFTYSTHKKVFHTTNNQAPVKTFKPLKLDTLRLLVQKEQSPVFARCDRISLSSGCVSAGSTISLMLSCSTGSSTTNSSDSVCLEWLPSTLPPNSSEISFTENWIYSHVLQCIKNPQTKRNLDRYKSSFAWVKDQKKNDRDQKKNCLRRSFQK